MIGPLSIALLASALLTGLLGVYAWSRRSVSSAVGYAALFFGAVTLYIGGYAMELAATEPGGILFWVRVEYLGIAIAPVLVVAMVLAYTGYERYLTPTVIVALLVVPVITLALVLTLSPLYYADVWVDASGVHPRLAYAPGPWFAVAAAFNLGALLFAVAMLGLYMHSAHPPFRRQVMVVLAGAIVPVAAYASYLAGLFPVPGLDPTPIALLATAIAFTIGVVHFRLFDLVPVARSAVFDRIPVGVLVIDGPGRVVEANPAAADLIGAGTVTLVGKTIEDLARIFPPLPDLLSRAEEPEIEVPAPVRNRTLAVSAAPLDSRAGEAGATVVLIKDITARRRAEGALARQTADLEAANRRLSLVSTFTRHDLANHLVAIEGYLSLLRDDPRGSDVPELLERLSGAVNRVRVLSGFVRDYPAIGAQPPVWLGLGETVERAASGVDLGAVVVDNRFPAISILADPLLERVFASLLENAVRHGGGVTRIVLGAAPAGDGLTLTVEDDGAGVAWPDKERIFERGFGQNTGLGLFLAREILESAGMTIAETGIPGHGARFEVLIPGGRFRRRAGTVPEGAGIALAMRHL